MGLWMLSQDHRGGSARPIGAGALQLIIRRNFEMRCDARPLPGIAKSISELDRTYGAPAQSFGQI